MKIKKKSRSGASGVSATSGSSGVSGSLRYREKIAELEKEKRKLKKGLLPR